MSDETLTTDIYRFLRGVSVSARITAAGGVTATAVLRASFPRYESSELNFRGNITDCGPSGKLLPEIRPTIQVQGTLPSGDILRLNSPRLKEVQGNELQLDCEGFTLGQESPPEFSSGRLIVIVRVPAAEILQVPSVVVQHGLGGIDSSAAWEDTIRWDCDMGRFLIANCYHLEHVAGPSADMIVQVPVGELSLESEMPAGAKPLEIIQQVEALVQNPLWVLSFLARRILLWYEIEVTLLPPPCSGHPPLSLLKRRRSRSVPPRNVRPILLQRQLRGEAFGCLVAALGSSPAADWLLRAIVYCIAAHEEGTVETELAMTLLAAEALGNGFRRLQKKGGAGGGANSLWGKLEDLIHATGVRTADLWPETISLSAGLEEAAEQTRNEFIHQARIADYEACLKNSARLRIITERGILKLLGWQDDAFHYDAFITDWLRWSI